MKQKNDCLNISDVNGNLGYKIDYPFNRIMQSGFLSCNIYLENRQYYTCKRIIIILWCIFHMHMEDSQLEMGVQTIHF